MSASFDRLDDPQGMFAAARRIEFETPLAHWALSWPEARRLPAFSRGYVGDLTHSLLRKPVTLPSGFSFAPKLTWRTTSRAQERAQRARWISLNTLPPLNWLSLLFGLPNPSALRVHVESSHSLTFVLLMTHDDAPLAYATRDVDFDGEHVKHNFFVVARGAKGDGVGAQVIANALALYPSLGIRHVGLVAGLTAGGAVWPRFGFRPTDSREWAKVKRVIGDNAKALPPAVWLAYRGGPAALDIAIRTILLDDNPDAIWMLHKLDPTRNAAQAGKLPHSLGGALLQGSRWRGILDLDDPLAMRMARSYLQSKIDAGVVVKPPDW